MLHGVRHRRELVEPEAGGLAGYQDRLADPRLDSVVRSLYASTQAPKTKPKPSAATTYPRRSPASSAYALPSLERWPG